MPRKYCQSCGLPTEYQLTKPESCSHCNHPFSISAIASTHKPKAKEVQKMHVENTAFAELKFHADIVDNDEGNRMKLGDIMPKE